MLLVGEEKRKERKEEKRLLLPSFFAIEEEKKKRRKRKKIASRAEDQAKAFLKIRKFGEVGECSKLVLGAAWLGGAGIQWQGVDKFKR